MQLTGMLSRLSAFWQRMSDERRGITTSEFWMSLATLVSTMAGALFGFLPRTWACVTLGLVIFGYTMSRGLAKHNRPPHDADEDRDDRYRDDDH